MANINATVSRRFEAGGVFTITPQGGTALDVLNIAPGSLKFKPCFNYAPIMYKDRSVTQAPLEGEDEPGEIELTLRVGKHDAELLELLTTRKASPDGVVREHSIVFKIPTYRGATTGDSITSTTASLMEAPQFTAGTDFDTVTLKFSIRDNTIATY